MSVQPAGSSVNVSVQTILAELHRRYGNMISELMQEISELSGANGALSAELAELRAKFSAVSSAPVVTDGIYQDLLGRSGQSGQHPEPELPPVTIDMDARRQ